MNIILKQQQRNGKLQYKYSPFYNYRIHDNTIQYALYKGKRYKVINENDRNFIFVDDKLVEVDKVFNDSQENDKIGDIKNLTTDKLNFNPKYPVDIEIQESYDKSVNLILNDNYNKPRIVNSRFSSKSLDNYEVVDREGYNDTNLYDNDTFDLDTSLYKVWNNIPKINYLGFLSGGALKVGNYVFYFKYADADGNETDFIGQSSIIPVFIGNDSDPFSINGGFKNMNSNKGVQLRIENIDQAYDYLVVYYTRSYADILENRVTSAYKINKKFTLHTLSVNISIFGTEDQVEVPLTDINTQYLIVDKVQTQAQCSNRLFFGGVNKPNINYKEFTDISLRILPIPTIANNTENLIGNVSTEDYTDFNGKYEYYNSKNVYNYVGYCPEEIYRFGVVYILNDNTHTPVFNIRGIQFQETSDLQDDKYFTSFQFYNNNNNRKYIQVNEETKLLIEGHQNKLENSKGVIQIPECDQTKIIGIKFNIQQEALTFLKNNLNVKGILFVRQKRIPTILAQGLVLPMDTVAHIPLIDSNQQYKYETFFNSNGYLTNDYLPRIKNISNNNSVRNNEQIAIICPEFEQNQPYYNQFFTGAKYIIKSISEYKDLVQQKNKRLYTYENIYSNYNSRYYEAKIVSVTENVPTVAIENKIFQLKCGEAEDASKFEFVETENKEFNRDKDDWKDLNVVRGIFGPYLGATIKNAYLYYGRIINIYISGYNTSKMQNYFEQRYQDDSTYYAISDILELDNSQDTICYRGDSYLCTYTHRLNRNFNDPSSPSNDKIVDKDTWRNNYPKSGDTAEGFYKMNRGDINAIQLGSWITFKLRSSTNLSIRSVDESNVSETAVMGSPRTFYPYSQLLEKGANKIPESSITNDGFRSTVGERWYELLPEVPYYKNTFENRVLYSEIAITDAFKNGYRVFYSTNFQDYKKEYGKIIKLVELGGNLLCVFEKAVGILTINERTALSDQNGGEVFINTRNVLPLEPKVLSDSIGSQWKESIIKTPYYVYGVDTRAKKIWRTNGNQLEIISDLKVNKFLVDNIQLKEHDEILIGVKNIKTHYNANKQDVIFTFYNQDKQWSLGYNEIVQAFITFYSWIPSYSENIQNQFWSFDRETSKDLVNLSSTCNNTPYSKEIILNKLNSNIWRVTKFIDDDNEYTDIQFTLEKDKHGYYKFVELGDDNEFTFNYTLEDKLPSVIYLNFNVKINNIDKGIFSVPIQITDNLSHEFWVHGRAGIYNTQDEIKPTKWYGTQHPFEFEFVVNEEIYTQKVFTNLLILSNKAEPESFHFEVVGENYEWSKDKKNIYYRQEALKELASRYGYNVDFNPDYIKITPEFNPLDNDLDIYYNHIYGKDYVSDFHKSILFPQYYFRNNLTDKIYDIYQNLEYPDRTKGTYAGLTGTEIGYNKDKSEFRVITHVQNLPIDRYGIRKGNSSYVEDEWRVQIPSIYFKQKDEDKWELPPIVITDFPKTFDDSLKECNNEFNSDVLPIQYQNIYDGNCENFDRVIDTTEWSNIKETKIRDKYIKIRVRYSGKELAIITGLITLYNESYG